MKIKRFLSIALSLILVLSLASCGTTNAPEANPPASQTDEDIISLDDAKTAVLSHSGVEKDKAEFTSAKLEQTTPASYTIVMTADNTVYNYSINAINGKIISFSSGEDTGAETKAKTTTSTTQPATNGKFDKESAKAIALEHAGLKEADVNFTKVKTDIEKGVKYFEVDFNTATSRYEYDINAETGEIVKYDITLQTVDKSVTGDIGIDSAKKLALDRVPGADDSHITIKSDYDNGRQKYEGKIIYQNKEYEFDIDSATGEFLEWSVESIFN